MIINIQLDYNPESNIARIIKAEVEGNKPSKKVLESDEPQIILETNKYTINPAAARLMQIKPDMRIDIKYQVINGVEYPVIGTEEAFGSGGGNKVTKSLTVSYRGMANNRLAKFGDTFTVTPMKDNEGLFVLIGNTEEPQLPDEITLVEDTNNHTDLVDSDGDELTFDDNAFEETSTPIDPDVLNFE